MYIGNNALIQLKISILITYLDGAKICKNSKRPFLSPPPVSSSPSKLTLVLMATESVRSGTNL